MTSNTCIWSLAACVRASALALAVFRDKEVVWVDRQRFDGRHPSLEVLAAFIGHVAKEYGVEIVVVEPGSMIEISAAVLDVEIVAVDLESSWQEFSVDKPIESNAALCDRLVEKYPRLMRFAGHLPFKAPIPAKDRRKMAILLAVAIGLVAARRSDRPRGLER